LIAAGAVVAGTCVVAGAVVSALVAAVVAPELFAGFELFVAAAVALVVALAVLDEFEDDDEADALAVVSAPATGAPAMLIALVDPN
jgi:hypothetical protein